MHRAPILGVLALAVAACDGGGSSGGASSSGSSSSSSGSASGPEGGQGGASGACASCGGACVDLASDPRHCGECGNACAAPMLCNRGACAVPACLVKGAPCPLDHVCCGDACCPPWKMCCNAPDAAAQLCVPVDAGACPTACSGC